MTLQSPRTQSYKSFRHPPSHSSMRSRASLALAALSLLCSAMCTNAFIMPGIVAPARSFLQVCCSLHSLSRLRTHAHPAMPPGRSTRGQRTPPARRTCYSAHLQDGQCCVSCYLHRPAVFGGEEDERRRLRKFCLGWIICLSYVPLSPNNCTHSTISRRCTHCQQTARWLTWRGWLTGKRCCLH